MGILIKNPQVERDVRELATLRGQNLTQVIGQLVDKELQAERAKPQRATTREQRRAATDLFRRQSGLDKQPPRPVTKAEWDSLWPTGIAEIDDA